MMPNPTKPRSRAERQCASFQQRIMRKKSQIMLSGMPSVDGVRAKLRVHNTPLKAIELNF